MPRREAGALDILVDSTAYSESKESIPEVFNGQFDRAEWRPLFDPPCPQSRLYTFG